MKNRLINFLKNIKPISTKRFSKFMELYNKDRKALSIVLNGLLQADAHHNQIEQNLIKNIQVLNDIRSKDKNKNEKTGDMAFA